MDTCYCIHCCAMPVIKPFTGIHPASEFAESVVLSMESLTISEAKAIVKKNPVSYANMLVPEIVNLYLRGSKKEMAYKKINDNFDEFLEKGVWVRDEEPAIYVYQIEGNGVSQTGIWTVTSVDDYLNNTIKKHELTRPERERKLIEYLQQTGVDANPVLIAYRSNPDIDNRLQVIKTRIPMLDFFASGSRHILWKVCDPEEVAELVNIFKALDSAYIADGHHRAAAACTAGIERRKLNLKHKGTEDYNFFSSVYMSSEQLRILEFNRVVKGISALDEATLLSSLENSFIVEKLGKRFPLLDLHEFGMYFKGVWYHVIAKHDRYNSTDPVKNLDVTILQDFVLQPVLGLSDPRTDNRIAFLGGLTNSGELMKIVDEGQYDIAFTLFPTSIDQLFAVADAGEVMPPKSTWFEPKFLAGLLIHQID